MATVPIGTADGVVEVELKDLTPRAAAVARIWSANALHTPGPLTLESVSTLREMGADEDEVRLWWGSAAMDRPHRMVLDVPSRLPGGYGLPIAARLEAFAQRLPVGYVPVGRGPGSPPPSPELAADADLLTRSQVVELMSEMGRPISLRTLANYQSRAPRDWPRPASRVGRTPLWSRAAIEAYAQRAG